MFDTPAPTPTDNEPTTVSIFNEQSLRSAIASVWGEHGAHIVVFDHLLGRAGPPPTNGPTRRQIAGVLDELVAETLRRAASSSTAWVEAEVDRATDAVLSLWASHRPAQDEAFKAGAERLLSDYIPDPFHRSEAIHRLADLAPHRPDNDPEDET